ncbi:hypothetical protein HYS93_01190 [Candidatus Daviesbacteria bacterium]|nr:hypothetical protein [Candidatus Daviesbacteria bacterium]
MLKLSSDQKGIASLLILIILLLGIVIGVYLTLNKQIFKPKASETEELARQIEGLTNQLVSEAASRPQVATQSQIETVVKRKELLLKEAEVNPEGFLTHSLSSDIRNKLPQEIQKYIEKETTLQGQFTLLHLDNFRDKKGEFRYLLKPESAAERSYYFLYFVKNPPNLSSDSVVEATGIALDSKLVMRSGVESPDRYKLKTIRVSKPSSPLGDQKTAVLIVNIKGENAQQINPEETNKWVFTNPNSVDKYYRETSFNKVSVLGRVFGPFEVDKRNDFCPYYDWSLEAETKARSEGIRLNEYNRLVYVFSSAPNCYWGGLGSIGGTPSQSWIFYNEVGIYKHELGHNFGVHHANFLDCHDKSIDDYNNCSNNEYGETFDVMGSSYYSYQFNAPHKAALEWIPRANIREISKDGLYRVAQSEVLSRTDQVLRIPKPDTREFYYVSYRQPVGIDSSLPRGITRGVSIHIWDGNPAIQTKLIDTTPGVSGENSYSVIDDASLFDNAQFSDRVNGVTIKQVSHSSSFATVEIKITPPANTKPTLIAAPSCSSGHDWLSYNHVDLSLKGTAGSSNQSNTVYWLTLTDQKANVMAYLGYFNDPKTISLDIHDNVTNLVSSLVRDRNKEIASFKLLGDDRNYLAEIYSGSVSSSSSGMIPRLKTLLASSQFNVSCTFPSPSPSASPSPSIFSSPQPSNFKSPKPS